MLGIPPSHRDPMCLCVCHAFDLQWGGLFKVLCFCFDVVMVMHYGGLLSISINNY